MEGYRRVKVRAVRQLTPQINAYELVATEGALPEFEPGAHVNVAVDPGLVRSYSLCNDPTVRDHYLIAVKREDAGRGGSRLLHQRVRTGDDLFITEPRNNFPLQIDAPFSLLLAGGIGITPLLSMLRVLVRNGRDVMLHVCTRSPEETPFREELAQEPLSRHLRFHHDGGVPGRGLDLGVLLRARPEGAQLYCCGPAGMMNAVRERAAHWPAESLHFESFGGGGAAAVEKQPARADTLFEVEIKSSGQVLEVPPGRSMLHVLLENGVYVDSNCEEGTCATCAVRVIEGTPDHRDTVLTDQERSSGKMCSCVSRACSKRLLVDL